MACGRSGPLPPPPPPTTIGPRRLGVISGGSARARASVTTSSPASTPMVVPAPVRMPRRMISRGIRFIIIRRVPMFHGNGTSLVECLDRGVGCPAIDTRRKIRKEMIIRFIINIRKRVLGPMIIGDISPCLSGRTVHIVDSVPG